MKSFRLWPVGALTLLAVGLLQADTLPPDPAVKFVTGGGHSPQITCNTQGCETVLLDAIGADGFASLDINNASGKNINAITFFIPFTNFDQTFTASTPDFANASIIPDETGLLTFLALGIPNDPSLIVTFFGVGNVTGTSNCPGVSPGCFTLPPDAEDVAEGLGIPGFTPGGNIEILSFFGPAPTSGFQGFANGKDGFLTLAADAPEPSTLWLSLSGVVGLLVARRKLAKT